MRIHTTIFLNLLLSLCLFSSSSIAMSSNNLKSTMNDFCTWTKNDGAQIVWSAWQESIDRGIHPGIGYFPSIEARDIIRKSLVAKIICWFQEQQISQEIKTQNAVDSVDEEYCNRIYSCAAEAFVSASWFLGDNQARSPKEATQQFIVTIETIVHEFIIPVIDACDTHHIDRKAKDLFFEYIMFVIPMLGKNIARCEQAPLELVRYLDEWNLSRGPASGLIICFESKIKFHQIDILKCEIDDWFASHSGRAENPANKILQATHVQMTTLCDDCKSAWSWIIGRIIYKRFRDLYEFRDAYKYILKNGFDQLIGLNVKAAQPISASYGKITLTQGDITQQKFSDPEHAAIVNAANPPMLGGGGIDGAIHKAAGPCLLDECLKVPIVTNGQRCPVGEARITPGCNLAPLRIIHTVGPDTRIFAQNRQRAQLLKNAYQNSLNLAEKHGLIHIALPSISTGIYEYDIHEAATIAIDIAIKHMHKNDHHLKEIRFVAYDAKDFNAYKQILENRYNLHKFIALPGGNAHLLHFEIQ